MSEDTQTTQSGRQQLSGEGFIYQLPHKEPRRPGRHRLKLEVRAPFGSSGDPIMRKCAASSDENSLLGVV